MASKSASKVVSFPVKTGAPGEAETLWIIAIAPSFKNKYSCEYDQRLQDWHIRIQASTFQGAENLVNECRRALGWAQMEEVLR